MRYGSCILLVCAATSLACAGNGEPRAADASALADTLKGLISDAYDFSRPGVVERMSGLYAADAQVVSASGGAMVFSRDSVRAGIARFWDGVGRNMKDPVWRWESAVAERLGDSAATLTGTWSIPHTAPNGQPHVIAGAWTAVFRRTSNGWKIIQEHLSSRD